MASVVVADYSNTTNEGMQMSRCRSAHFNGISLLDILILYVYNIHRSIIIKILLIERNNIMYQLIKYFLLCLIVILGIYFTACPKTILKKGEEATAENLHTARNRGIAFMIAGFIAFIINLCLEFI